MINDELTQGYIIPKVSNRVESIDVLKGFAMLFVIWSHTAHREIYGLNPGTFGNISFFMLSGVFFKVVDVKTFMQKKAIKILLPFLVFYILSYPFRLVVEYWDYRDFGALTYEMIWDVFKVEGRSDYLYANVPLWFLLAIFVVQVIGLAIFRLPKWCVLIFAAIVIFLKEEIYSVPTPFMINNALYWVGFFALGYLYGKNMMEYLKSKHHRWIALAISLVVFILTTVCWNYDMLDSRGMIATLQYISLAVFFLAVASFFDGMPATRFLKYLGVNTLLILCVHVWFLVPMTRVVNKLGLGSWQMGIVLAIVCSVIMIPFINFVNRRLPILAGK